MPKAADDSSDEEQEESGYYPSSAFPDAFDAFGSKLGNRKTFFPLDTQSYILDP